MSKIRKMLKNKRGAAFMMMAFIMIVLFFCLVACLEVTKVYTVKFDVETKLNRLTNNVVESNIDLEFRQDGYNYLNVNDAKDDFYNKFYTYTETTTVTNDYVPAEYRNNGIKTIPGTSDYYYITTGDKFSPTNGEFLYMIRVDKMELESGASPLDDNGKQPYFLCSGTIFIANSLPGRLGKHMLFQVPFQAASSNFNINSEQVSGSANIGEWSEGDVEVGGEVVGTDEIGDAINGTGVNQETLNNLTQEWINTHPDSGDLSQAEAPPGVPPTSQAELPPGVSPTQSPTSFSPEQMYHEETQQIYSPGVPPTQSPTPLSPTEQEIADNIAAWEAAGAEAEEYWKKYHEENRTGEYRPNYTIKSSSSTTQSTNSGVTITINP